MSDFEKYFRVIKIVPTIVHNPKFGQIDLRDLSVEQAKELYEDDFPYLELTEEGKKNLFPPPPPPPPVTAKDIVQQIKTSKYRSAVLKLKADNPQFTSVQTAADKRLAQLDNN